MNEKISNTYPKSKEPAYIYDQHDCDAHGHAIRYRCEHYKQGRKDGRADALRQAVQAVNAVPGNLDSSAEWDRDYEVDLTGQTRNPRIWVREATAAIEALSDILRPDGATP